MHFTNGRVTGGQRHSIRCRGALTTLWLLALTTLGSLPVAADEGLRVLTTPRTVSAFSLPGIDGTQHRLSDYLGRYLLINVWAVWCAPCRQEMPSLNAAYRQLRSERFEMLAIHAGPSLAQAGQYARQLGLRFPIAVDAQLALSAWQVRGLPHTLLLNPKGQVIAEAVGERVWDHPNVLAQLRRLMR